MRYYTIVTSTCFFGEWALLFVLGVFGWSGVDEVADGTFTWAGLAALLGWILVPIRRRLSRLGRRLATEILLSPSQLGDADYVLYLRPFDADRRNYRLPKAKYGITYVDPGTGQVESQITVERHDLTLEEELASIFKRFGRPIAVGRPGEKVPLPGADRMYLPRDGWKPVVSELIRGARLVIIVGATTESILWELIEARRLLPLPRLVILAHGDESSYELFRTAVRNEFGRHIARQGVDFPAAPELPDPPPPDHRDSQGFWNSFSSALWGAVRFEFDGTPHFFRFDDKRDLKWGSWPFIGDLTDELSQLRRRKPEE
ncbi:hypothetical protein [Actinomadura bangladeshensis]|uniref:Uncharacterized protein n=1 Tax=Actinomadura bangladeshensis TaxID=453573 RepID=A0A4R4PAE6_9ACTN|nr:hypothetical protein [Actinomadura bangladeshensis]TDC17252.1 hypothetical protein E1284_09890 [Actinomadura bangladeshensis]